MRQPFTRQAIATTIVATAALASGLASAAPVVTYATVANMQLVNGIQDLVVGTDTYDVSLVSGSYRTVFSNAAPSFLADQPKAISALQAIVALFNAQPTAPTFTTDAGTPAIYIPSGYEVTADLVISQRARLLSTGLWGGLAQAGRIADANISLESTFGRYAMFTLDNPVAAAGPAAVPEPASLALVGLALAGVAASRRQRAAA